MATCTHRRRGGHQKGFGINLRYLLVALLCASAPTLAMDNPGSIGLFNAAGGDFQIGAAGTQLGTPQLNLGGMNSATFQVQFLYGSGGTTVTVYIQTSLDHNTWTDIGAVQFTLSSGTLVFNVSALDKLATPTAPTNLTLTPGTTVDGILGDQLRAVVVSTGTYGGGSLVSVRGVVR